MIARASSAGVTRMVTCGSDLETSRTDLALARGHEGLYAAVGIHGHRATTALMGGENENTAPSQEPWRLCDSVWDEVATLAADPQVVAIGEIGLDYHYDFSPRDVQRAVLARQLDLACSLDLPVILHNRESDEDMRLTIEGASPSLRGVMHCFLADLEMAEWVWTRGLYMGIAGPITFKNVRYLDDIVRRAPRERLLVETDCPYLSPHPKRGRRNEPAHVVHVAAKVAELLDLEVAEVARMTYENACRLFGIESYVV